MTELRVRRLGFCLGLMLASDAVLLLVWDPGIRAAAALALGLLPGVLLVDWAFPGETGDPVSGNQKPSFLGCKLLGVGTGYALFILSTLLTHYLPGPLHPWPLLTLTNGLALLFLTLVMRSSAGLRSEGPTSAERGWRSHLPGGLAAVLVLGATLRLAWLGYSEFQGDEAIVMLKAAAAVQGREDALFLHKKGPAEILIPTALLLLAGSLSEAWARLPFALAGIGGVAALYLLGREAASRRAGLWAALLLALNGYFLAFSRMVQYQSLVFFLSTLALWCGYRFWQGKEHGARYLTLTGLLAGVGLLAHYDAAFILPPLGYLIWHRWRRSGESRVAILRPLLLALAVLTCVVLSFYLPFVLHPHFEATRSYIGARTGGRPPYLNLDHFWVNGTIYNSVYYLVLVAGLLLLGLGWNLTLLRASGNELLKATWLWFVGPFLLYCFLLRDPRTHLYIIYAPGTLLAGMALAWGLRHLRSRLSRGAAYGLLGSLIILSAGYLYVAFLQHQPLYRRTYPQHRLALYPTPYGDRFPEMGIFGFPYRAGWKVIGALYEAGILQGDYDSNEEEPITRWYTRGAVRCPHWPRYYFIAWSVQDEVYVPSHVLAERYGERGVVEVDGDIRLRIFERDMPAAPQATIYRLPEFANNFDVQATAEGLDTGYPVGGWEAAITHHRSISFEGGSIQFVGYSLCGVPVQPGGAFSVLLYWQARGNVPEDYTVFVHLEDGERIWAQKDGPPHCAERPTSTWQPGELIVDEHSLVVDPSTPPGSYPLQMGLYILETGRRLQAFTSEGTDLGGAVELELVTVVEWVPFSPSRTIAVVGDSAWGRLLSRACAS